MTDTTQEEVIKERSKKTREYLLNPNKCKHCQKEILPSKDIKLSATKLKIFCNKTCANIYNHYNRIELGIKRKTRKDKIVHKCICGNIKNKHSNICIECFSKDENRFLNRSKERVLSDYKSIEKGFIAIRKHSRYIYNTSNKSKYCTVCGYDKHYEICHIKAVSEFEDNALIKEINNIDNLTALCRNHHWELDNGLLKL